MPMSPSPSESFAGVEGRHGNDVDMTEECQEEDDSASSYIITPTYRFTNEVDCGQFGINMPIPFFYPCSTPPGHVAGVQFYTQCKTITQNWASI
ncbi:hypothetical protein OSTOST_06911 [Ostertagia ostertagi]